jgi:hypothetical protein
MLRTTCCDIASLCIDSGFNLLNNVCVVAAGFGGSSEVVSAAELLDAVCESGASESGL